MLAGFENCTLFSFNAIMLFYDKLPPWIYLHASYDSSRGTPGRNHLPNVFVSVCAQLLSNPSSVFSFSFSSMLIHQAVSIWLK